MHHTTLGWVPLHGGVDGNEHADNLTKIGAGLPFFGLDPCCGISKATDHHVFNKYGLCSNIVSEGANTQDKPEAKKLHTEGFLYQIAD